MRTQASSLAKEAKRIGKRNVPVKDGILRRNVYARKTHKGFKLVFKVDPPAHMTYQNEGFIHHRTKEFVDRNQGFVEKTFLEVSQMILKEITGKEMSFKDIQRHSKDKFKNAVSGRSFRKFR